jgi:hypothetical protein
MSSLQICYGNPGLPRDTPWMTHNELGSHRIQQSFNEACRGTNVFQIKRVTEEVSRNSCAFYR